MIRATVIFSSAGLSARVCVTSAFDSVADVDQWPAMIDWLLDQHARFRRAIQAVGGLGSLA
jgi:hypothetical protein